MTTSDMHVVVGDDYLTSAHCSTVGALRSYRHWWKFRNIDFFVVSPAVTSIAHIANRVIERNEKAITGYRGSSEIAKALKNRIELPSSSQRLREAGYSFQQSLVFG